MNEKTIDFNWRMKNSRFMLLLLIPVFYFAAFFYMGKRVNQPKYTKMGIFYAVTSLLTFALVAMGAVYFPLFLAGILHIVAWLLCIVQTLQCRKQYLQYVEWKQEDPSDRSKLTEDKSWRRRVSFGCLWTAIPLFGGLGTCFIGRRMDNRKLQWFGALSVVAVIASYLYISTLLMNGMIPDKLTVAIGIVLLYSLLCIHPLLVGYYYEDYLDATALIWEADEKEFPVMMDPAWRRKGSLWQIATCIPSVGSLGLFWVAFQRQSGRTLLGAALLCAFEMGCIMSPSILTDHAELMAAHPVLSALITTFSSLWFLAYVLNIFYGTLIRWDMLRLRAWLADQEE